MSCIRLRRPDDIRPVFRGRGPNPLLRELARPDTHDELIEALASFREVHQGWAREYIETRVDDPLGTGGTPYVRWLQQLIDETRAHAIAG